MVARQQVPATESNELAAALAWGQGEEGALSHKAINNLLGTLCAICPCQACEMSLAFSSSTKPLKQMRSNAALNLGRSLALCSLVWTGWRTSMQV